MITALMISVITESRSQNYPTETESTVKHVDSVQLAVI